MRIVVWYAVLVEAYRLKRVGTALAGAVVGAIAKPMGWPTAHDAAGGAARLWQGWWSLRGRY